MTDVNIATRLLIDAYEDAFDVAVVVSGDSDLVLPVLAVRRLFPKKTLLVAFPPRRQSYHLKKAATASFSIGAAKIRQSQLPNEVTKAGGYVLHKPEEWR